MSGKVERSMDHLKCFSSAGLVSGAAKISTGVQTEAEGGGAEHTHADDRHDPQPEQQQTEERRHSQLFSVTHTLLTLHMFALHALTHTHQP